MEARKYVDQQCVKYKCWLIDSGTLGTKANTQVRDQPAQYFFVMS